jgi:mannose-6-phosphate isomerase-like protein (cupin superfamily)
MKRIVLLSLSLLIMWPASAQQNQPSGPAEIRRVVTKIDSTGKSVVMFDSQIPLTSGNAPGRPLARLWVTQNYPADFSWSEDSGAIPTGLPPPKNGTHFVIVDYMPTPASVENLPMDTVMKVVGADVPKRGLPPRHPLMHRTRTVDYAIVLSGEIVMLLDEGEVHLKAGDVLIQQATNHAWINRGKVPCRVAFVMMDAQEP